MQKCSASREVRTRATTAPVRHSRGEALDSRTRAAMESRFRFDFGNVRVHADSAAASSARELGAQAFTAGNHVSFARGRYAPSTPAGTRLLAHELAHVVQQSGAAAPSVMPMIPGGGSTPHEREADTAAEAVMKGQAPRVSARTPGVTIQRHKDDAVAYMGGQSSTIVVINAGTISYVGSGVSGHPGHGEHEKGEGPTPAGLYKIHPQIVRAPVTSLQDGTCGAKPIPSGYQEITSTDQSPCSGAHYCNVSCPTTAEPTRKCFTPQDCWGPKRIKIVGSADVPKPGTKRTVHRDGFYLHGGNPADAVSSGCVKSLSNDAFDKIRELTGVGGVVPFCVGSGCPKKIKDTIGKPVGAVIEAAKSAWEAVTSGF